MNPIVEEQVKVMRGKWPSLLCKALPSGAHLIEITDFDMPPGWNMDKATLLFVAPPAFPAAQPDCFWVESIGPRVPVRLKNGATPQNTNDSNPIPDVGQRGTWFSWHLQTWNPNTDTLMTYFNVVWQRLKPAR
jgi:hypothetical protein